MALRIPAPEQLDEVRAEAVLRELRFPLPTGRPGWTEAAFAGVARLRDLIHEPVPTFAIGEERVRHRATGPVTADSLVCSCGGRACVHVAAVLLVVAYNDPVRRMVFDGPAWEIALAPMVTPPAGPPLAPARFRYLVRAPAPGRFGLELEPRLVRTDAAGRETEGRAPRTLTELLSIPGVTPTDLALYDTWNALEQVRRLERGRTPVLLRHLSRQLLAALSRAPDVQLEGAPIRVSATPVAPVLTAFGERGTALTLRFEPRVENHWPDAGVVCVGGVLAPLSELVPAQVAARLGAPEVVVPHHEVSAFVSRMVVDRGLAVALPAWLDPVGPADARAGRIVLSEGSGELLVDLAVTYECAGARSVVLSDDPSTVVRIPGGGIARRDFAWERDVAARFAEEVGGPLRLAGDEALGWLTDVLPGLVAHWPVDGEERLVRNRVRGTLTPRIHFSDGVDWFDLDVRFALGDVEVAGVEVVRGWLTGQRWHRLDDGSVASLPTRWLERHAPTVDSLAEVRRAQRGLGSWHAWTASDLLEEVGAPAERWLGWVRATARDTVARRPPPPGLQGTLRPYQQTGFEWLCFLRDHGLHGVLADEMGLGKTIMAIAFLLDTPGPALVVTPTSVLHNWQSELARFAPSLRVVAWHGAGRSPAALDGVDVVVTSWALLRRDSELLSARTWCTVVLDEVQNLKNPASQTARAARRLRATHRMGLSGTPVENDLVELWSLFQFLMPGYLGRRSRFHARYQVANRDPDAPALRDLARRIRPFLLRRRKAEVARELPPRTDVVLRISLSERERRLYELVRNTVREAATAASGDELHRTSAVVLEGLTRLRQACCHPALLPFPEARHVTRSAKVEALLEALEVVLPAGGRVLVFSQWVRLLDEVARELTLRGLPFSRLDGSTRDRASVVNTFQSEQGPGVMLVSVKAGGTGLNLTAADHVYLLDPWWNPAVEAQAADRAHRIGQLRPVTVVRMVAIDTVEERVLALQAKKQRLFDETVGGPALDVSALGTADLLELLTD